MQKEGRRAGEQESRRAGGLCSRGGGAAKQRPAGGAAWATASGPRGAAWRGVARRGARARRASSLSGAPSSRPIAAVSPSSHDVEQTIQLRCANMPARSEGGRDGSRSDRPSAGRSRGGQKGRSKWVRWRRGAAALVAPPIMRVCKLAWRNQYAVVSLLFASMPVTLYARGGSARRKGSPSRAGSNHRAASRSARVASLALHSMRSSHGCSESGHHARHHSRAAE